MKTLNLVKHYGYLVATAFVVTIIFAGCSKEQDETSNPLIGRWQRIISSYPTVIYEIYNFQSDTYGIYTKSENSRSKDSNFEYLYTDESVTFTRSGNTNLLRLGTKSYSVSGDKLKMGSHTYTRQ